MNNEDDERFPGDDPESSARKSERKRQREKQRRSDLANAFDELASLLTKLEPGQGDPGALSTKKKRRRSGDIADLDTSGEQGSGLTRLDLIGRSIEAIKRLHKENQELKQSVGQEGSSARGGSDEKEVLVMVPTLTSTGSDEFRGVQPSYPAYYQQPQQQPYPPQHHPPPQPLAHTPQDYAPRFFYPPVLQQGQQPYGGQQQQQQQAWGSPPPYAVAPQQQQQQYPHSPPQNPSAYQYQRRPSPSVSAPGSDSLKSPGRKSS